jgi:excisionase family DNA binding protein
MPEMTLSEAAKWAGVTRPTIHKALTSGRLSGRRDDNGQWRIDPAELERVYLPRKTGGGIVAVSGNSAVSTFDIGDVIAAKEREIELLREIAAKAEAREADLRTERDRLLGIVETAQRQLTHQPERLEAQIAAREDPGSIWPRSATVRAWLLARLRRP